MKAQLYKQDGTKSGEVELPADLFSAKINEHLVHLALVRQHANARIPSAHTLRRGEVAGTTAKMYRQKGTGRARVGAKTSPIRRGGGVAWGPRNTKNYTKELPKKARRGALASVLSDKAKNSKVVALESWELPLPKTKEFEKLMKALPAHRSLLVVHARNDSLSRSARNLKDVKSLLVNVLNIHDLLKYDQILFEKSALIEAEKIFKIEKKKTATPATPATTVKVSKEKPKAEKEKAEADTSNAGVV